MTRDSLDGQPLLPAMSMSEKLEYLDRKPARSWRNTALLSISVALNIAFMVGYAVSFQRHPIHPYHLYSPAQDVLEYKPKLFNDIWFKSEFNAPPSPALDEAWEDLYDFGVMQIPKDQAVLFPNRTSPIPGDEQNYIFTMDVFHQLHCLNMIRQALYPEYYNHSYYSRLGIKPPSMPVHGHEGFDHTTHCIDSLRETVMCSSDVTPLVWVWDDRLQQSMPRLDVVHSCRNFEKVQEWGKAHALRTFFDNKVHIEDDLEFPEFR